MKFNSRCIQRSKNAHASGISSCALSSSVFAKGLCFSTCLLIEFNFLGNVLQDMYPILVLHIRNVRNCKILTDRNRASNIQIHCQAHFSSFITCGTSILATIIFLQMDTNGYTHNSTDTYRRWTTLYVLIKQKRPFSNDVYTREKRFFLFTVLNGITTC